MGGTSGQSVGRHRAACLPRCQRAMCGAMGVTRHQPFRPGSHPRRQCSSLPHALPRRSHNRGRAGSSVWKQQRLSARRRSCAGSWRYRACGMETKPGCLAALTALNTTPGAGRAVQGLSRKMRSERSWSTAGPARATPTCWHISSFARLAARAPQLAVIMFAVCIDPVALPQVGERHQRGGPKRLPALTLPSLIGHCARN